MSTTITGTNQADVLNGLPFEENIMYGENGNDTITGWFFNDILYGGNGDDILHGDQSNALIPAIIPDGFIGETPPMFVVFGNDILYGGKGDDIIAGDQGIVNTLIIFATSIAMDGNTTISDFSQTGLTEIWGNDTLYGGDGNDHLYGDTITANILAEINGDTATADGLGSHAIGFVTIDHNTFILGNDTIYGDAGNDVILGDNTVVAHEPGGGIAIGTNGGLAEAGLNHFEDYAFNGNDIIYGGSGNDIIYGDADINSHEIVGGNATADTGGTAITHFLITDTTLIFGNDALSGGDGNDIIYGDSEIYYNALSGGTATADHGGNASSTLEVNGTIVNYGNDSITGDQGNDILFGDTRSSIIEIEDVGHASASNGGVATVSVNFLDFTQISGNDTISGGQGNDIIVGDTLVYELLDDKVAASNVMIGGVDHVKIADSTMNNIIWGNDVLSGGGGSDKFIWSLFTTTDDKLGTQGFDEITDFAIKSDTLAFGNLGDVNGDTLVNLADLKTLTTLTHSGDSTIINFNGGGSILLDHMTIGSLDSLHIQLSAAPIVV